MAQALEKPTLQSNLRHMQFRDQHGNIISMSTHLFKSRTNNWVADPDRSNPTRPRLERPLDTIRSFEAAIDGSYNRRYSQVGASQTMNFVLPIYTNLGSIEAMSPIQSRPSSFYPGKKCLFPAACFTYMGIGIQK